MAPFSRYLANICIPLSYSPRYGVIGTREVTLSNCEVNPELYREVYTFVLNSTLHDIPSLSFTATLVSPSSRIIDPKRIPRAYILGMLIQYSIMSLSIRPRHVHMDWPPSSGRCIKNTRFSPSMTVETELPKNLDFGFNSPEMRRLFAGDI